MVVKIFGYFFYFSVEMWSASKIVCSFALNCRCFSEIVLFLFVHFCKTLKSLPFRWYCVYLFAVILFSVNEKKKKCKSSNVKKRQHFVWPLSSICNLKRFHVERWYSFISLCQNGRCFFFGLCVFGVFPLSLMWRLVNFIMPSIYKCRHFNLKRLDFLE